MTRSVVLRTLIWASFFLTSITSASASVSHDREFWREIARHEYKVPAGESSMQLARELSELLGSPDAELRDDLAYSILATWIAKGQLSNNEILSLSNEWRANLRNYDGKSTDESILRSSFSVLCLSEVAARDNTSRFLEPQDFRGLLSDALTYLNREQDVRGYDPTIGWIHATAHTADLLRELASNPLFGKQDQSNVLSAISGKLSSTGEVYTHGEQDRLAMAVVAIIRRSDFDDTAFHVWLRGIRETNQAFWKRTRTPAAQEMAQYQNRAYFIEAIAARLSVGTPLPGSNPTGTTADNGNTAPWSPAAAGALHAVFSLLSEQ